MVHFYNKRDAEHVVAEVDGNVNTDELGDLKRTKQEEKQIVAFLKTLPDGYNVHH